MIFTKVNEAYEAIKAIILRTDPREPYAFSEGYFSETLHMSRTPVRSALQRLQFEDLITIIPHQGIVIRDVSYEEARQLFDFRRLVENYLIQQSVNLLNDLDFDRLQSMIEQQKEIASRLDFDAFLKADEEFHLFIYHHYDNPGMKQVIVRYKDKMYRSRYKSVSIPGRVEFSIAQHQSMLDLLHAKRADETIRLLEEHLSRHERMMLSGIDRPVMDL